MTALVPPREHAHLRWHWIKDVRGNLLVAEWLPDELRWFFRRQDGAMIVLEFTDHNGSYHGPCDPTAIVPDPSNEVMVERIARAIAPKAWKTYGLIGTDSLANQSRRTASLRHAKNALRDLAKGE